MPPKSSSTPASATLTAPSIPTPFLMGCGSDVRLFVGQSAFAMTGQTVGGKPEITEHTIESVDSRGVVTLSGTRVKFQATFLYCSAKAEISGRIAHLEAALAAARAELEAPPSEPAAS